MTTDILARIEDNRELALELWDVFKTGELNEEGIKGKEKQERLIPSGATIAAIDKGVKLGMKETLAAVQELVDEIFSADNSSPCMDCGSVQCAICSKHWIKLKEELTALQEALK